jgi:hypothetical protein
VLLGFEQSDIDLQRPGRIYVQRLVAGDSRATGDLLEFVVGQAERSDDVLGL